jgi:hypothetical protein
MHHPPLEANTRTYDTLQQQTLSEAAQNLNIRRGRHPTPLIAAALKERGGKTLKVL